MKWKGEHATPDRKAGGQAISVDISLSMKKSLDENLHFADSEVLKCETSKARRRIFAVLAPNRTARSECVRLFFYSMGNGGVCECLYNIFLFLQRLGGGLLQLVLGLQALV